MQNIGLIGRCGTLFNISLLYFDQSSPPTCLSPYPHTHPLPSFQYESKLTIFYRGGLSLKCISCYRILFSSQPIVLKKKKMPRGLLGKCLTMVVFHNVQNGNGKYSKSYHWYPVYIYMSWSQQVLLTGLSSQIYHVSFYFFYFFLFFINSWINKPANLLVL